jgi:hypothetical protein
MSHEPGVKGRGKKTDIQCKRTPSCEILSHGHPSQPEPAGEAHNILRVGASLSLGA